MKDNLKMKTEFEDKREENKWRCAVCHFDNYFLLPSCEICETQRPKQKNCRGDEYAEH